MAIVVNGTKNLLDASQLPAGYNRPNVTAVANPEYKRLLTLNIPKATVQNASAAATMANILADAGVGINKQIADILAADFLASANVTAHAELIALGHSAESTLGDSPVFTDAAINYVATVYLFVKAL